MAVSPDDLFARLIAGVTRALTDWEDFPAFATQDAVQYALTYVLERLDVPQRGYRFTGALPAYLIRVARHKMLAAKKDAARTPVSIGDEPDFDDDEPNYVFVPFVEFEDDDDYRQMEMQELLVDWQERYRLAESYFRDATIIKEIWQLDLQRTLLPAAGSPTSDKDLAEQYNIPLNTIFASRRRLHGRMSAMTYLIDFVPEGFPDSPNDMSILAWLFWKQAISQGDIATIRNITALVRAAGNEGWGLVWALFSRWLTWQNGTDDVGAAVAALTPLLANRNALNAAARTRFERAGEWFSQPGRRAILARLRGELSNFFIPACWYLAVLQQVTANDAVRIVNVSDNPDEERQVRHFIQQLK